MSHTHNGKVFSHRKEENPAICDNTIGPWGHYTKRSKPDRERQTLLWPHSYMESKKTNKQRDTENRLVL